MSEHMAPAPHRARSSGLQSSRALMSGRNSALADRRGRGIARALLPGVIGLAAFTEELADEGNPMLGTLTPGPVAGSLDPFLARHPAATTPFLVVDLDVVRRQYCSLTA